MALHLRHRSREVKQRTAFARRVTGSGQADAQPAALPLPTRFNGAMARGMLTVRTNGRGETILEAHRWPESGSPYVCSSVCAHREQGIALQTRWRQQLSDAVLLVSCARALASAGRRTLQLLVPPHATAGEVAAQLGFVGGTERDGYGQVWLR